MKASFEFDLPETVTTRSGADAYAPVGWRCPRCGAINAPWVVQCPSCCGAAPSSEPRKWPTYTGDPLPGQAPTTTAQGPT